MTTSLIFGSEQALQTAGANFPTFGKKLFLPQIFAAKGQDVYDNFLFVVQEEFKVKGQVVVAQEAPKAVSKSEDKSRLNQ